MSARGRKHRHKQAQDPNPHDFFVTPAWCAEAIPEHLLSSSGWYLEPSAGNGAIVRALSRRRPNVRWHLVELRGEEQEGLEKLGDGFKKASIVECPRNFFDVPARRLPYACVPANPPYSLAPEVIRHAMHVAPDAIILMLLRLDFLGSSADRLDLVRDARPDVWVFSTRPGFTRTGTDANEYAWFAWRRDGDAWGGPDGGVVRVLDPVPPARRGMADREAQGQLTMDECRARGAEPVRQVDISVLTEIVRG